MEEHPLALEDDEHHEIGERREQEPPLDAAESQHPGGLEVREHMDRDQAPQSETYVVSDYRDRAPYEKERKTQNRHGDLREREE